MPDCVAPSDQVTVHGAEPVRTAWMIVAPPGQIAADPETAAMGFGSTVTVAEAALGETQPFASVTVSESVVVPAGLAVGAQLAAFDSPAAGAHAHETPPDPDSGVDDPAQIWADPDATAFGRGFTVIAALPDAVPAQFPSETAVTAYVVVEAGETDRVAGEAATFDCVAPSDQTTVHGAVPVSAAWTIVAPPAQIWAVPETEAVGFGLTVTGAEPDDVPLQCASDTAVTV